MNVPSHFLAMLCPKKDCFSRGILCSEFINTAKVKPNMTFTTESFVIYLMFSSSTKVAVDQSNQITLILHGEIYNSTEVDQAQFLIKQYVKYGETFSKDINGSFAILLIDERNDVISLITDRVNSRKVFSSKYKGNYWLSTSMNLHPTIYTRLDVVGVADYLANGVIHNGRTLFEGIHILERACTHKLTERGFSAIRYWTYEFTNLYSGIDQQKLCAELFELIIESIRIRLKDKPRIFLSLSGGYDASGILCVLGHSLKVKDVECFSYIHGKPRRNSDAYVSRKMANYFGFNHKLVESYKGNLMDALDDNVRMFQGCAQFCDEIDVWKELSGDFSADVSSILFAGDECFGWTNRNLFSDGDMLATLGILDFRALSWLSDRLPGNVYKKLYGGLHEGILHILKRCPATNDYHESKDFLYLDQRLNHRILIWRESFAGQFVRVRTPFLDNSILDFMKKIPTPLRLGKYLYKKTIMEKFPELFKIKRARTAGFIPNWGHEFTSQIDVLERLVLSQDSKLDEIIPPGVIVRLLRENKSWRNRECSPMRMVSAATRILSRATRISHKMMRPFSKISERKVDHTTLLKRILVMRLFLGKKTLSELLTQADEKQVKNL